MTKSLKNVKNEKCPPLYPLGQDDFIQEDIKIIKENVKLYINALIKEAGIV